MKKSLYTGTALCLFLAMAITLAQSPQTRKASLPAGSATISEWKGDVVLHSEQGAAIPLQKGVTLNAGTLIQSSKGSLLLTLEDGSQVLIEPNSEVILEVPGQNEGKFLQQVVGKILAKARKRLGGAPSFRMGTPTAVISVRGTEFEVLVDRRGKTSVEVYEGLVEVQGLGASAAPVMVGPGLETEVEESTPPEPPHEHHRDRTHNSVDNAWPGFGGSASKDGDEEKPTDQTTTPARSKPNKDGSSDN